MIPLEKLKGYCTQAGLRVAISPLHNMDEKADHELTDGEGNFYEVEYKKEHYHILIAFGNTTTYSAVLRHVKAWKCVSCVPVSSIVAQYRYLKHLDEDPEEKFIYNRPEDLIQHVNGFDLVDYASEDLNYSVQNNISIESVIDEWIQIIPDIWCLFNFLKQNNMIHELKHVYKNEKHFKDYIYWSKKHSKQKIVSDQTIDEIAADPGL